jgi:hypothetical protein
VRGFSIVVLVLGCALLSGQGAVAQQAIAKVDPITRLVERLAASHLWRNGMYPDLGLPATATTDQVIARLFEMTSFEKGEVKQYRILETRQVQIGSRPGMYTAAIVQTDLGSKVVLLKYESAVTRWWSRVYDSEPSA